MGARSGLALKGLQWFLRGIQFLCAALILGVYSYFLAALHNHDLHIETDVRAVEGISGAAVLYTLVGLLLLCCCAGLTLASLVAMLLDLAFIGAFIYVAWANRNGAGSCDGYLDTPFGNGRAGEEAQGNSGGFTDLPRYRTACKLQSACFAVAIVAIVFFLLSILVEFALVRHHRKEKRFGPSPSNNYTKGSGSHAGSTRTSRGAFMPAVFARRGRKGTASTADGNTLPHHPQPVDNRHSYATETTAVNHPYPVNNTTAGTQGGYVAPHGTALGGDAGGHKYDCQQPLEVPQPMTAGVDTGYSNRYSAGAAAQSGTNYGYSDGVNDRV